MDGKEIQVMTNKFGNLVIKLETESDLPLSNQNISIDGKELFSEFILEEEPPTLRLRASTDNDVLKFKGRELLDGNMVKATGIPDQKQRKQYNNKNDNVSLATLLRKHSAAVVVMAFDEDGQAATTDKKVRICKRWYNILVNEVRFPPQGHYLQSQCVDANKTPHVPGEESP
jgi:hypothetical protein